MEAFSSVMPYFGRKLGTGYIVVFKVLNYSRDCLLGSAYYLQALSVGWEMTGQQANDLSKLKLLE